MLIQRVGQRIISIGGPQYTMPRSAAAAAAAWYLSGGIAAANCLAAYTPKGAASLAASYDNNAAPGNGLADGTYDCTLGTAPTFNAATGWTFVFASKQYLKTGIVPVRAAWTYLVRFTNATSWPATGRTLLGAYGAATKVMGLGVYWWGLGCWTSNGDESTDAGDMTAGILAMAGVSLYRDGVWDSDKTAGSGINDKAFYIGALNETGGAPGAWSHMDGNILAISIYDTILTAPQVAAVSAAMAAL